MQTTSIIYIIRLICGNIVYYLIQSWPPFQSQQHYSHQNPHQKIAKPILIHIINMEDEMNTDVSSWTSAERKKLQYMTEFHQEYQQVFGE